MDFEKLLAENSVKAPTEPRELYASLPDKAPGYGYLRDVQGQVLAAWHERRDERDLVVKVNTGGGKTIDGLVILQSHLNEGNGPALYVAPDIYLATQVQDEAERLGITTVGDPDHPRYLSGEAIAVINVAKLVNGRSVFASGRPTRPPAPIGAVVIDDAHAALVITRAQLSIELPLEHPAFEELLELFRDDLAQQSPNALLDIDEQTYAAMARVPFWAWRAKVDQARSRLHAQRDTDELRFTWPAVSEVLPLCRVVFTGRTLTITPPCPPIRQISGFAEAKRRVYLTATLADDSVLVTDFGAAPESVRRPITPLTAGDIGERMILAPQEITPDISAEAVRQAVSDLATNCNVVVLVPSRRATAAWSPHTDRIVYADGVAAAVEDLRARHVGLVVLVNKYDGIDLPGDACRVLVLDGLPEVASADERLESLLLRQPGTDDRQVQRIEQGMGRGVRSNEDHCVVFLLGPRLSQLVADPRSFSRFGPATRAQLELSRTLARNLENQTLVNIMEVAAQALERDPSWVQLAKLQLASIPAPAGAVSSVAVAQRGAFELATDGSYRDAAQTISTAAGTAASAREKGWLLEQKATYLDHVDPAQAQQVLAVARTSNPDTLRPLSGVTYLRLSASGRQAQRAADFLASQYQTAAELRLAFQTLVEDLAFDPGRTDAHEEALARLADHLGIAGQRPEQDLGEGPDVLWALGDLDFWVIEDKSGAVVDKIHKRYADQLSGSIHWFERRYDVTARATPVMVHPARKLAHDATAAPGTMVLTRQGLDRLRPAILAFSAGLASDRWDRADTIERQLIGHQLRASDLRGYLQPHQPAH